MSKGAHFHKLKVAEVRRETADAVSLRFELPEDLRERFQFRAGQHLTLRHDFDGLGRGVGYNLHGVAFLIAVARPAYQTSPDMTSQPGTSAVPG